MTASIGAVRLDSARVFSRLMTWICLTLSVSTTIVVASLAAFLLLYETTTVIPCQNTSVGAPPFQAKFTCRAATTTTRVTRTTVTQTADQPAKTETTTSTTTSSQPDRWNPADLALPILLAPPLLLAAALWQAGGFFRQLFKGCALNATTVRRLRNFSVLGVLFLVLSPMTPDIARATMAPFHLQPPTLTWGPGDIFGWKATVSDVLNLVFAATLIAMVSVLARAAALAEDHAQIV